MSTRVVWETSLFTMRRSLLPILVIVCGFIVVPLLVRRLFPPELPPVEFHLHGTPLRLAEIKFRDGSGREFTLNRFRGSFVLLNIWATWCPPCKQEMSSLNNLASLLAGEDLAIAPISIDVSASEVRYFYRALGLIRLPIYVDPSKKAMHAFAVRAIPTTLLINPRGFEIARMVGPAQWDAAESVRQISTILKTADRH